MISSQSLSVSVKALLLCLLLVLKGAAQQPVSKAADQPYSLSLTTKFHSTGHSIYNGQYLNHHPNAEIGLSYKYRKIGGFMSKSTDLADLHSSVNFATIGVFKSFKPGKWLTVTPYAGMFLRQSQSFADDASDAWACIVIRYRVTSFLTVENTTLVGNLIRHHAKVSLANRLNASLSIGKIKVDVYGWYCRSRKSNSHFASTSIAVTSPDWVISPSISARLQVAMLQHVSPEKPEGALRRGGLVSLIVPINLLKAGGIEEQSSKGSAAY